MEAWCRGGSGNGEAGHQVRAIPPFRIEQREPRAQLIRILERPNVLAQSTDRDVRIVLEFDGVDPSVVERVPNRISDFVVSFVSFQTEWFRTVCPKEER